MVSLAVLLHALQDQHEQQPMNQSFVVVVTTVAVIATHWCQEIKCHDGLVAQLTGRYTCPCGHSVVWKFRCFDYGLGSNDLIAGDCVSTTDCNSRANQTPSTNHQMQLTPRCETLECAFRRRHQSIVHGIGRMIE